MRLALVLLVAAACGSSPAKPAPHAAAAPACLADSLGKVRDVPKIDVACEADNACKARCEAGDPHGCMMHALRIQQAGDSELALPLFARACRLGLAIGCTNVGAYLWLGHQPASSADVACAMRLFERACDVRESFGCGMVGRMLAGGAKTPELQASARAHFDKTCTALGGVICRMYAWHLELGDLGTADPATVHALMQRACDTGDTEACGDHATVGETFHE